MRIKNFLFLLPLCGLLMAGLASCNSEETESKPTSGQNGRTYRMVFDADYLSFDALTRASLVWEEGDCVYLTLSDGEAVVPAQATYKADKKEWEVYVTKSLSSLSGSCAAYYFLKPTATTAT